MTLGKPRDYILFGGGLAVGIIGIPFLLFVLFASCRPQGEAMKDGADGLHIGDFLRERIGWSGISIAQIDESWEWRYRDTTRLYKVRLSAAEFAELQKSLIDSSNKWMTVEETHGPAGCVLELGTAMPELPGGCRLPAWWDIRTLKDLEGVHWRSEYGWGMWFGFDPSRQSLFIVHYTT